MSSLPRRVWFPPLILAALIVLLWAFPAFWFTARGKSRVYWFAEKSELPGWSFRPIPIDQAAEKFLVADRTFNGEFKDGQGVEVSVFSAKRYEEKAGEIGLFMHTPDRCWVEAGWKINPEGAATKDISLEGGRFQVERRIFSFGGRRELVYFFGLIGGQSLPYRLDHNLSIGLRSSLRGEGRKDVVRASDAHFWARLWDAFQSRRELLGPKQFIRISTNLGAEEISAADQRLESFIGRWLVLGDYAEEKRGWAVAAAVQKNASN